MNLEKYLKVADEYEIYQADQKPVLIRRKKINALPITEDASLYDILTKQITNLHHQKTVVIWNTKTSPQKNPLR